MNNLLAILFSILFVFFIIGLSSILGEKNVLTNEGTRKFIHIGVANWWFIAMLYFDSRYYAAIIPAIFVVLNYISYKKQVFKSMERQQDKNNLGTVYYAISLLVLSFITFGENYDGTN